jgi:hypothetical protein
MKFAAERGDAGAQIWMGDHELQVSSDPDPIVAMEWYRKAAAQADATGIAKIDEGRDWCERTAKWYAGANASFALGHSYIAGPATPDYGKAYFWFAIARVQGNAAADKARADAASHLTADQKAAAERDVATWLKANPHATKKPAQ